MYGRQSPFSDPHDYLFNMFHTKSTRNHSGVNDPQLDALIDKEGTTIDQNERVKLVKEIQRYVADTAYYAPSATGVGYIGVQEWLKGYQPSNNSYGGGAETFAKLGIDRGLRYPGPGALFPDHGRTARPAATATACVQSPHQA